MNWFKIAIKKNMHGRRVVIKNNVFGAVFGEARRVRTYSDIVKEMFT